MGVDPDLARIEVWAGARHEGDHFGRRQYLGTAADGHVVLTCGGYGSPLLAVG